MRTIRHVATKVARYSKRSRPAPADSQPAQAGFAEVARDFQSLRVRGRKNVTATQPAAKEAEQA